MSSQRSQRVSILAQAPDGNGGGGTAPRAAKPKADAIVTRESEEGTLGPVPPPLPDDPALRAELVARLERGIAEARAGRGTDYRLVHARLRAKYNLP